MLEGAERAISGGIDWNSGKMVCSTKIELLILNIDILITSITDHLEVCMWLVRILGFTALSIMLSGCGRDSETVLHLEEDGTPLIRSLLPRSSGEPFQLIREVEFGSVSQGEDGRLFRPAGITEVPGGVAILDADSNSIKVYESSGTLRLTSGGRGQGPGEFDSPRISHGLSHDGRIFVTDGSNQRFTWIDPRNGTFESQPQLFTWSAANVAEDQFVVIRPRFDGGMQLEALELVNGEFDTIETLTQVKPGRVVAIPAVSGNTLWLDQPMWPPFGWWVRDGIAAICQGDEYRIEVFNTLGDRIQIVEWDAPRLPVTDAAWDSIGIFVRRTYPNDWATVMHQMERPEYVAAVENLRIDGRGRIWALRDDGPTYATHIEYEFMYWDIIDTDGSWLGTQTFTNVPWYFGTVVCYMIEEREQGAVVVRYRLEPSG